MKDEEKTKAQLISELAALRRSEEQYRRLLDEMSDGYVVTHRDRIVFANRPIAEMLGCSVEQVIGRSWKDFFESELVDYIDQTRMEDLAPLLTAQVHRPDGDTLFVELALRPATYRGELAEFTLVRDVTERVRAEEALWQRTDQLEALREMGLELAAQLDLDALLHSVVSRAAELLGGISGSLYLYQPHRDVLEWHVAVGPHPAVTGTVVHRGEGLVGTVWETGEPLVVDEYWNWEGRVLSLDDCPFVAVVGAPVRWGGDFLGVLEVLTDTPGRFSPFDAELLGLFASHAAAAIKNAQLHRELRDYAEDLEQSAGANGAA